MTGMTWTLDAEGRLTMARTTATPARFSLAASKCLSPATARPDTLTDAWPTPKKEADYEHV